MHAILLTLALLHSGDAITTSAALSRGGIERNPVMPQSPAWNVVLQASETTAELYVLTKLNRTHPRIAKSLAVVAMSIEGYAVVHNVRTLRNNHQ